MKNEKRNTILKSEALGFLLWQSASVWQRELRRVLEPLDITHSQCFLLISIDSLSNGNIPVTQISISNLAKIDPMTTSTVLRTLQTKGLVSRKSHSDDSRAKAIVLTAKGKVLVKKALAAVEEFDATFFANLGAKPKKMHKGLLALLKD
jgi:DNA-binding MarR family transcriptional regulator